MQLYTTPVRCRVRTKCHKVVGWRSKVVGCRSKVVGMNELTAPRAPPDHTIARDTHLRQTLAGASSCATGAV